ncbi:MAG: hypothetical protein WDZ29_03550 [Balneolaceae bacterium]
MSKAMMLPFTRYTVLAAIWALFIWPVLPAEAQDRIPREFANPDEVISLDRQTSFPDAIDIISSFVEQYDGRILVNRTGYTGTIGISLPAMHWRDALDYILRIQNFVLVEDTDFIELLTQQQVEDRRVEDGPEAEELIPEEERMASTSTREVRINATFFEGNRRALQEIGVDWSTLTQTVPDNITDFIGQDASGEIPTQDFDQGRFVQVNSRGAQSVSQNVFNSIINFGEIGGSGIEVQALFSAFEADNLGEVLATPTVKVMDGEEGRVQVGQDFSIKQRDFAGNVTDQFFSTGTILTVTPQVITYRDTTFIYLELEVERSSASPDPVSTIINKEQTSTHTLLLDGESTVIAGLYRNDRSEVRRGIPILKDLPGWFFGLRYLFGFNSTDISQNELIVIVQAELEETLSERISQQLLSRREVLEDQQLRHRTGLDHLPVGEPGPEQIAAYEEEEKALLEPQPETEPDSIQETEKEPEQEPVQEIDPEPETVEEDDEWTQTEVPEEVEIGTLEGAERELWLRAAELEGRDISRYAGEYRTVPMVNINGEYDHLIYYTIGGSFQVKENAERLYRQFREAGYRAHILHNPDTEFYFVAYAGFDRIADAVHYTRMIQSEVLSEAWLSRIRTEIRLDWNGTNGANSP